MGNTQTLSRGIIRAAESSTRDDSPPPRHAEIARRASRRRPCRASGVSSRFATEISVVCGGRHEHVSRRCVDAINFSGVVASMIVFHVPGSVNLARKSYFPEYSA